MSIQTQHSISHLLYVSSVPIVYWKGGVIFRIKILYNIYQESIEASTRQQQPPRFNSYRAIGHYQKIRRNKNRNLVQPY